MKTTFKHSYVSLRVNYNCKRLSCQTYTKILENNEVQTAYSISGNFRVSDGEYRQRDQLIHRG